MSRFFALFFLCVIGTMCGCTGYWVSDRESPTRIVDVKIDDPVVAPGGLLTMHYDVSRIKSCAVKIDRILYDSQRVRVALEDLDFGGAPGPMGNDTYTVKVGVPRVFAPGPATYQTVSRYVCNPLHNLWPVVVIGQPVPFMVAGDPVPAAMVQVAPPP